MSKKLLLLLLLPALLPAGAGVATANISQEAKAVRRAAVEPIPVARMESARAKTALAETALAETALAKAALAKAAKVEQARADANVEAARIAARQQAREQYRRGARFHRAWRTVYDRHPVWPEPVPLPEWRAPVLIPLERLAELETVVGRITAARASGKLVLTAWSPRRGEYAETDQLQAAVGRIASLADGFLLAYHRSGAHFRLPTRGELAFLAAAARCGNPKIALFGEAYFGELEATTRRDLSVIAPPGISATVIWNAARSTVMTANLIAEVEAATALPVVLAIPEALRHRFPEYPHRLVFHFDPQNN